MKVKFVKDGHEEYIDIDEIKDKDGISISEEKEDNYKKHRSANKVKGKICAITPFVCTIAYVLMGSLAGLWHPGWLIFLLIPVVPSILYFHKNNVKSYIVDAICLILCVGYFVVGFVWHIWHPTWVVFLLIPVLHILFDKD